MAQRLKLHLWIPVVTILLTLRKTVAVNIGSSYIIGSHGERVLRSCSPEHLKHEDAQRFNCTVVNSCDYIPKSFDAPLNPHDFRINKYLTPNALNFGLTNSYELRVNFSWQPPYGESLAKTRGFLLRYIPIDGGAERCFTFLLTNITWKTSDSDNLPRFRFTTIDLLEFGREYKFELQSLPINSRADPFAKCPDPVTRSKDLPNCISVTGQEFAAMPEHPVTALLLRAMKQTGWYSGSLPMTEPVDCNTYVHPKAHHWLAAFSNVVIVPYSKSVFTEFYAAPKQYCFDRYELRLYHSNNGETLADSHLVTEDDLYEKKFGNFSAMFGNHTFTNVSLGNYDIGVQPIDRRIPLPGEPMGRCVCHASPGRKKKYHHPDPNSKQELFSGICSCTVARWGPVNMPESIKPAPQGPICTEKSTKPGCPNNVAIDEGASSADTSGLLVFAGMLAIALVAILAGLFILSLIYRHYKKAPRQRIKWKAMNSNGTTERNATWTGTGSDNQFSGGPPSLSAVPTSLPNMKLLIVYSHDSPTHEKAVEAFANYMKANCYCDVFLDQWSVDAISRNKMDWIVRSIQEAHKVVIINSYGAFARYQVKLASQSDAKCQDFHLEQQKAIILDDIFLTQLDIIGEQFRSHSAAYSKFTMAYFSYTDSAYVVNHISPYVRFELPRNLESFVGYLHNIRPPNPGEVSHPLVGVNAQEYTNTKEGQELYEAVLAFQRFEKEQPKWFEKLHVRVMNTPVLLSYDHLQAVSKDLSVCNSTSDDSGLYSNSNIVDGSLEGSSSATRGSVNMLELLLPPSSSKVPLLSDPSCSAENHEAGESSAAGDPLELKIDCEESLENDNYVRKPSDRMRMLDSGFHDEDNLNNCSVSSDSLDRKVSYRWNHPNKSTAENVSSRPLLHENV